jgi:hypothetical protein
MYTADDKSYFENDEDYVYKSNRYLDRSVLL